MRLPILLHAIVAVCITGSFGLAAEDAKIPLKVLYLGRPQNENRTKSFDEFLTARFTQCTVINRDEFDTKMVQNVDVVVLDWSQQERTLGKYESPLGPLENWATPTVFLGSAGLLMAGPWSVIGGAG